MTEKKTMLKLIGGLVSLFFISVLLVVSSAVLFRPNSFAWFADNDTVNANGMQVKADKLDITIAYYRKAPSDAEYVEIESFDCLFDGILPGETVKLKVAYDSKEANEESVTVYLSAFDGCEVPLILEGKYYYFGTQLKVLETDEFLLEPSADYLSYEEEQVPSDIELGSITLAANSVTEFEFSIQFVNYPDIDQNAYQGFGALGEGECCFRKITSVFE